MAGKKAKRKGLAHQLQFLVVDANEWQPQPDSTDVIWIMESSEHFRDKKRFFERCATRTEDPAACLRSVHGFEESESTRDDGKELVATIGKAMLSASLDTLSQYATWMREANLDVEAAKDITGNSFPRGSIVRGWLNVYR